MLDLVYELCNTLAAEEVSYCHWKSNISLDRSIIGENDLDLLVRRSDMRRLTEILHHLGFKQARGPSQQRLPGVLSYYGYDKVADKFVHVHAHVQLILGHDMTKNYRLPIEKPLLESADREDLLRIPSPEFELIIFVIRMVLKHSTWDAILSLQGTLSVREKEELQYLTTRAQWTTACNLLRQHLPCVDETLFSDCMRAVRPNCPVWNRMKAGHQLQTKLRAHARSSQIRDVFVKLGRRALWAIRRRVFKQFPKKQLASGGAIIALVGGDGAGKSTIVGELYSWLSMEFSVITVHLGKPDRSWTTVVVKAILKVGQTLGFYPYVSSKPSNLSFSGFPWLVREVCRARDRYLTYVKARRFANNGGIVICDRYPLPQVRSMDSLPFDLTVISGWTNRLMKSLMRAGNKYYQQIALPELLIALKVDPAIAVQRKVDEPAALVRARSTEMADLDWQRTPAHVIDGSRSLAEVRTEAKALIWSEL